MLTQLIILTALAIPPTAVPAAVGIAAHTAIMSHKDAIVEKIEPIRADAAIWWRQATMDANESCTPPTPA